MAKYQTTLALVGAYSVDATMLQDIFQRAKAFLESDPTIEVDFSEVHTLKSESLTEVLDDSLVRTDVITKISISGMNVGRRFHLKMEAEVFRPTVAVDIWGNQELCRNLSNHIERLLRAKRQWYSLLISGPAFASILPTFVAFALLFAVPVVVAMVFSPAYLNVIVTVIFAGAFFWIMLLFWFRRLLFPQLIVEIGRSAEIAARARGMQTLLFGGVILAFLVAVAAELTASKISN